MKRHGNIYNKIYDYENLKLAHFYARKGKSHYKEVQYVNDNEEECLINIQNSLIYKTYKTSEYETFIKLDTGKERLIYKLPYHPDRIIHWAIMLQIKHIFHEVFVDCSHASIDGKGVHSAYKQVRKILKDTKNVTYCLKIDVKKFFPNINHDILKSLLRRKIKDCDLLGLLDDIIDSTEGVPIGNYLSQYFANFYLSYFDHYIKENLQVKHYVRYMDDMVFFHSNKKYLHKLRIEIERYLEENLKLTLKKNYQVFPTFVRGVDFLGYRFFKNYTLLRKTTSKNMICKMRKLKKKCNKGKVLNRSEWCSYKSYLGWTKWCNGYNLCKKHLEPIRQFSDKYYEEVVKNGEKHSTES